MEVPINARGLIYFVPMEIDNKLTINCNSDELCPEAEMGDNIFF